MYYIVLKIQNRKSFIYNSFHLFVYTCIYVRLKKCLGKTRQNIQRYTCIDLYIKIKFNL